MLRSGCFIVVLLPLSSASSIAAEAGDQAANLRQTGNGRLDIRLFDLAAVRRLLYTFARRGRELSEGERAATLADFTVLTEAVVGGSAGGPFTLGELVAALSDSGGPRVSAAPGAGQRDDAAYQLLSLGYSASETAAVVSRRISQRALDTAQRMIAVGKGRDAAATISTRSTGSSSRREPRREDRRTTTIAPPRPARSTASSSSTRALLTTIVLFVLFVVVLVRSSVVRLAIAGRSHERRRWYPRRSPICPGDSPSPARSGGPDRPGSGDSPAPR